MSLRSSLKLVDSPSRSEGVEVTFWPAEEDGGAHSLHGAVAFADSMRPEIPCYLIKKYSQRGGLVLDPFSKAGVVGLEANLLGRPSVSLDLNPLSVRIARAKVEIADITEVTLRLQQMNLRRPVGLDAYHKTFKFFYDVDTFRELVNLRAEINAKPDRVSRFIELVAMGLLHGHSAGYLSAYSYSHLALSPEEQDELNMKRRQMPDYRAVVPRVLRKTAQLLQDGGFSALEIMEGRNRFEQSDARAMSCISNASVDLTVTAPPVFGAAGAASFNSEQWIRNWFAGINSRVEAESRPFASEDDWLDYMGEFLFELARVTKARGRAALVLRELVQDGKSIFLDEMLTKLIESSLGRFWEIDALIFRRENPVKLKDAMDERADVRSRKTQRILVLRRRG